MFICIYLYTFTYTYVFTLINRAQLLPLYRLGGSLLRHKAATDCFFYVLVFIYLPDAAAPRRSRRRIFNFSLANWKSSNGHTESREPGAEMADPTRIPKSKPNPRPQTSTGTEQTYA